MKSFSTKICFNDIIQFANVQFRTIVSLKTWTNTKKNNHFVKFCQVMFHEIFPDIEWIDFISFPQKLWSLTMLSKHDHISSSLRKDTLHNIRRSVFIIVMIRDKALNGLFEGEDSVPGDSTLSHVFTPW